MESCGGANYWARVSQRSGDAVKLISPQFVKPFVKTNKNDANDALAIVEAACRPSINFVPINQVAQQDIQSVHRIRTLVVKNRTALINEIRGLCQECEIVVARGAGRVKSSLCTVIRYANNRVEQSHEGIRVRERGMRKFKSIRQAQGFVSAHAAVQNLFNLGRHLVGAQHYRDLRISAFGEWSRAVA